MGRIATQLIAQGGSIGTVLLEEADGALWGSPHGNVRQLVPQRRQVALDGVPYRAEIDGIIAVNQRIAHAISQVEP